MMESKVVNVESIERVSTRKDIEEIIEILSGWFGVRRTTIRNVALVYGLAMLIFGGSIPNDDDDFNAMLSLLHRLVNLIREDIQKLSEMGGIRNDAKTVSS